jgi:spoIIIJ-associated protein
MEATEVIMSARTVEEARELGLKELGVDLEEAEVEIISHGKPPRFLGLGAEPARVRVRRIAAGSSIAPAAVEIVTRILQMAGTSTTATLRTANDPNTGGPLIDITGEDSGLLIGRKGETLRALQFIVNLMVRKRAGEMNSRVVLDIEKYRERRQDSLRAMATRVADRVVASGRSIALEPMPAAERRIVHMALADHPRVTTQSAGTGEERKITVMPKVNAGNGGSRGPRNRDDED